MFYRDKRIVPLSYKRYVREDHAPRRQHSNHRALMRVEGYVLKDHRLAAWPRAINGNKVRQIRPAISGKGKLLHPYGAIDSLSKRDCRISRHGDVGCSLACSLDGKSLCNVDADCSPDEVSCWDRDCIAIYSLYVVNKLNVYC